MVMTDISLSSMKFIGLLSGVLLGGLPAHAEHAPQARLVHCHEETCLRISGHRPRSDIAIRIGGHELAVEGGSNWRVTVPLAMARAWATASGDALTVALFDPLEKFASVEELAVPPGALGRRVELATLMVHAR